MVHRQLLEKQAEEAELLLAEDERVKEGGQELKSIRLQQEYGESADLLSKPMLCSSHSCHAETTGIFSC